MINVNSEIGHLRKVLVHRPDKGIARISPKRAEELLFDDIVYLPQMQAEHDVFFRILGLFLGHENVLETQDLLVEALAESESAKQKIIEMVVDYEELPLSTIAELQALSDEDLAEVLITGYLVDEDAILFDPIPNFIFTRDIAVAIKDHVIITKAAKEARHRENLLTRFVFYAHPMFERVREADKLINLNHIEQFPPSRTGERVSIEGGDVMMLADDFILVGCSERTSNHAFESLKKVVFDKDIVGNIVQINIPNDRSCMHIDTLFTRISEDDVVCYRPTIYDGVSSNVIVHRKAGDKETYSSVKDFLRAEVNRNMNFIFAGDGKSPYQEREQWTDGCNLVAIRPGIALTYDRNPKTELAFHAAGYTTIHAEELLTRVEHEGLDVNTLDKTIILLSSGELSRARGGSHCMTCPLVRDVI